jgi:hypothetical protein
MRIHEPVENQIEVLISRADVSRNRQVRFNLEQRWIKRQNFMKPEMIEPSNSGVWKLSTCMREKCWLSSVMKSMRADDDDEADSMALEHFALLSVIGKAKRD